MSERKREGKPPADRLGELERQADEVRRKVADLERKAEETLERAEDLEEKNKALDAADHEIRRKAHEPIGFPPPPKPKQKGGAP